MRLLAWPAVALIVAGPLACAAAKSPPAPSKANAVASPIPSRPGAGDAGAACQDLRDIEEADRQQAELARAASQDDAGEDPAGAFAESHIVHGKGRCSVADDNIGALETAILEASEPKTSSPASGGWDRHTAPGYMDVIDRRFTLGEGEKSALARNGFVVPARLDAGTYGVAFHEIFQSQLPLFVSVDALMHAIYAGNDKVITRLEKASLEPMLKLALARMQCTLPGVVTEYPEEVGRDLDVYLGVARGLALNLEDTPTALGDDLEVASILHKLGEAEGLLGAPDGEPFVLFGRPRVVDASMFRPRGHYTSDLSSYFRAASWLSRLEFNLVSRSCKSSHPSTGPDPSETPREDLDALALADLAERSGALPLWAKIDRAWSLLAGRREDLSLTDLVALRKKVGIVTLKDPSAPAKLRTAIGDDWKRTARTHFTPDGVSDLPAIATILGVRIGPDASATRKLVRDTVPNRTMLHATDMAYVLGNDRAKAWLAKDLQAFPTLGGQLDRARRETKDTPRGPDLYGAWFGAIEALSEKPKGALPSFMDTTAWADLRLDSTIAAFGQLRHNYVLMAAGTYDSFGCEIPDGYVEPAPATLDAIIAYAERGAAGVRELDPRDDGDAFAYFGRVARVARTLRKIVTRELAGQPLTDEQKRFIGMAAEYVPRDPGCFDSCPPPTYTGWWYDLFIDRIADGTGTAEFIADYYTSTNAGRVAYVGAKPPRFGIFVVDTNGPPRAMVGPVAHAYEHVGPLDQRLTDAEAHDVTELVEPWSATYTLAAPQEPSLDVAEIIPPSPPRPMESPQLPPMDRRPARENRITLEAKSTRALGPVTLELLDHHRGPLGRETRVVGATPVRFLFDGRSLPGGVAAVVGLRVRVGGFSYVSPDSLDVSLGQPAH